MALYGALAEHVRRGEKIERYEMALDNSNPTPIVTGFKEVIAVFLTLKGTAAPGVGTSVLTYNITGGLVDVYAWKVTNSSTTTLVASTGTETFSAIVIGK
jgi:hypothetical protein